MRRSHFVVFISRCVGRWVCLGQGGGMVKPEKMQQIESHSDFKGHGLKEKSYLLGAHFSAHHTSTDL